MSKEQELINQSLDLANKGAFDKSFINKVIKADYYNQYESCDSLMSLYAKLSLKYGKSKCTIMKICN